jgi:DNA repair protein RadC
MNVEESKPLNIKDWNPEDRPREKLLLKGISTLSDAELIAILIGSGTAQLSAVEVGKKMLQYAGNLDSLAKLSVKELMKVKGIGEAKAISIVAALELGRRRKELQPEERPKIESSHTAFELIKGDLMDLPHEEFWVILLNRAHRLIRKKRVSEGGVNGTVADPRIIFKLALEELASGIIVVHNHPSGNLTPSQNDISLTKKLKEGSRLLDMTLLDHLIVSNETFMSFSDDGWM